MASVAANKRLTKEYKNLKADPVDLIFAKPSEKNVLQWHYIITGPPNTPFENGEYHGTLTFPSQYPFKPPAIRMVTPNGRFAPNAKLCLSISDFHPETWNPAWSVGTILTGLMSFMTSQEVATGCIKTTEAAKRVFARNSAQHNRANVTFVKEFADYFEEKEDQEELERKRKADELESAKQAESRALLEKWTSKKLSKPKDDTVIELDTQNDSPDSFDFNDVEHSDDDIDDLQLDENCVVIIDESDEDDSKSKRSYGSKSSKGSKGVKGREKKRSKTSPEEPIVID